jgi:hypothetical protein
VKRLCANISTKYIETLEMIAHIRRGLRGVGTCAGGRGIRDAHHVPGCEGDRRGARRRPALSPRWSRSQTAPNSRKSVRQNKLSFPILSDVKGKVGEAFGLRFHLPDYLVELYKS